MQATLVRYLILPCSWCYDTSAVAKFLRWRGLEVRISMFWDGSYGAISDAHGEPFRISGKYFIHELLLYVILQMLWSGSRPRLHSVLQSFAFLLPYAKSNDCHSLSNVGKSHFIQSEPFVMWQECCVDRTSGNYITCIVLLTYGDE